MDAGVWTVSVQMVGMWTVGCGWWGMDDGVWMMGYRWWACGQWGVDSSVWGWWGVDYESGWRGVDYGMWIMSVDGRAWTAGGQDPSGRPPSGGSRVPAITIWQRGCVLLGPCPFLLRAPHIPGLRGLLGSGLSLEAAVWEPQMAGPRHR